VLTCFTEFTALQYPSSSCQQKTEVNRKVANYTGLSACLVGSDRVKADAGSSAAKIVILNYFSGKTSEETDNYSLILTVWMAEVKIYPELPHNCLKLNVRSSYSYQ
jgi:hypothetical protein